MIYRNVWLNLNDEPDKWPEDDEWVEAIVLDKDKYFVQLEYSLGKGSRCKILLDAQTKRVKEKDDL